MSSSPSPGVVAVGERVRVRATREGFVDAVGRVAELTEDGFTLALEIPVPNYTVGQRVRIRWSNGGIIERDGVSEPSRDRCARREGPNGGRPLWIDWHAGRGPTCGGIAMSK